MLKFDRIATRSRSMFPQSQDNRRAQTDNTFFAAQEL